MKYLVWILDETLPLAMHSTAVGRYRTTTSVDPTVQDLAMNKTQSACLSCFVTAFISSHKQVVTINFTSKISFLMSILFFLLAVSFDYPASATTSFCFCPSCASKIVRTIVVGGFFYMRRSSYYFEKNGLPVIEQRVLLSLRL
jgi:hypothetical protein